MISGLTGKYVGKRGYATKPINTIVNFMHPYKIFFIFMFSALTGLNCLGQESKNDNSGSSPTVNMDSVEFQIAFIRKEYNQINADIAKYRVVKEDLDDQSAEGGELKKFYEGESLRKVKLTFYGETGKAMTEFYFLNNTIIFCFKRTYYYNMPISEEKSKVDKVEEERFYFNKLIMIRWIGPNGKIVKAGMYVAKEKEINQILNEDVYKK